MERIWKMAAIAAGSVFIISCERKPVVPEALGYEVISTVPHDAAAYTQGLQWTDGRLFESTGQKGQSSVRLVDRKTGGVLRKRSLPAEVFGEGLTMHGKDLFVITWQDKTAYVLDPENFSTRNTFSYQGEGWGLTSNGKELIMSNGGSKLAFRNPKDFSVIREVEVTDKGHPVKYLNELEWVDGVVFANVYTTNRIARIDPDSGAVTGWLDLSALAQEVPGAKIGEVLNGVAYDAASRHFIVTGKNWPKMFEIRLK